MDRGAWRPTVHEVAESWTRLSTRARLELQVHWNSRSLQSKGAWVFSALHGLYMAFQLCLFLKSSHFIPPPKNWLPDPLSVVLFSC